MDRGGRGRERQLCFSRFVCLLARCKLQVDAGCRKAQGSALLSWPLVAWPGAARATPSRIFEPLHSAAGMRKALI